MLINLTPHVINFNDGQSVSPSGQVARVSTSHEVIGDVVSRPCSGGIDDHEHAVYCGCGGHGYVVLAFSVEFGEIVDLPDPEPGKFFLVSAVVLQAAKATGRIDCCAPATGHPDARRENGRILSVPGVTF